MTPKKFRKRPVVIEAVFVCMDNLEEAAKWCGGDVKGIKLPLVEQEIEINTLEGDMRACVGDWIIKGVKGEFYPCKNDIFQTTYDEVLDPPKGTTYDTDD